MSSRLQEFLEELDRQKQAYHEKTLSVEGEWSMYLRTFQIYDLYLSIADLLIPEFYMGSMALGLLFDFDLTFIEPFNLEFEWRYPTLEEWLKGVGVVIEKIMPDWAVSVEDFVSLNIEVKYQEPILETRAEKGYYGKSRVGYFYVDPTAVREFLRNAVTLMSKRHPSYAHRRAAILSAAKALNVPEDLARYVHDRMAFIRDAHVEAFILDYGMLDVSYLCEEEEHSPPQALIPFTDLDGEVEELDANTLSDVQYGFILDFSQLDVDYLCEPEDLYRDEAPAVIDGLEEKLRRFRGRLMITAPAISNYVRGDEAADHFKCERTNVWGELQSIRYAVEAEVDAILARAAPNLNDFDRRKYVSAVLQLLGHLGKRHRWGYGVFKAMEEPDLRAWWLEYWGRQGLDINILGRVYDAVKAWLPQAVSRKVELGRRLRLQRLGLPL